MSNILLGSAIGDSLGMPFESKPADNPLLLNWDGKTFLGSEYHKLIPGQFTDDTQFSCTLAQSLVDCNGFDPDDISKRYVELFTSQTIRGYGRTTLMAIQNLQAGKGWWESGINGSYGNGTFMRASPLGVFFKNDLQSLVSAATIDAKITHNSDEAVAGSLAAALAVAFLSKNEPDGLILKIIDYLPGSLVKQRLINLPQFVNSKSSAAQALALIGSKADVRQSVPAVFYCFSMFNNYLDGANAIIRCGGDTDTHCAVLCSLYGAQYGLNHFDKYHIKNVENSKILIDLDKQLSSR